jgi:F-box domain
MGGSVWSANSDESQLIAQTGCLDLHNISSSPGCAEAWDGSPTDEQEVTEVVVGARPGRFESQEYPYSLIDLPNEVLLQVFAFLDVSDLLVVSRVSTSAAWLPVLAGLGPYE